MKRTTHAPWYCAAAIASLLLAPALACKKKSGDDPPKDPPKATEKAPSPDSPPSTPDAPETLGLVAEGGAKAETTTSKTALIDEVVAIVDREQAETEGGNTVALPENALALLGDATVEDKGDFVLEVTPGPDSALRQAYAKRLADLVAMLNGMIKLPKDIPVKLKPCGQPNAFWHASGYIQMCDELVHQAASRYGWYKTDRAAIETKAVNLITQAFLHEVGHGLIDLWKLPATGREEDAVDQLSAILLIGEDGTDQIVLDAAEYWLAGQITSAAEPLFWDEHSFNEVRFYNLICLVFGSNEQKYRSMITDLELPLQRAAKCVTEYREIKSAWKQLLERFMHGD